MGKQVRVRVPAPVATKPVWVIQRCYLNVDRYWTGAVLDHDHRGWSIAPNDAAQFNRKEDAYRVMNNLLNKIGLVTMLEVPGESQ